MRSSHFPHRLRPSRGLAFALAAAVSVFSSLVPAAADEPLQTIRIIDPRWSWSNGYELVDVADAQGIFRKNGLKLEWVNLPLSQYTTAIDGDLTDFAPYADYAYFINVKDKGLDVREVVASSLLISPESAGDGLFVTEKSPITSASQLKNKKVGMEGLTWSSAWFTLDYLSKQGVTKEDVTYLGIPQSSLEQVLQNGDIDAAYFFPPGDAELRKRGGYRQLFKLSDLSLRPIVRGGTMAKSEFIKKHPDLVRKYVESIAEAADWANLHPADVIKLGIEKGRIAADIAPYVYTKDGKGDYSVLKWAPHAAQNEKDVQFWLDLVERQGIVEKGKYKAADLFTNEFNSLAIKAASN